MARERIPRRLQKRIQFFFFTEGQTECNYFDQIKKDLAGNNRNISVQIRSINKKSAVEFVKYAQNYLLSLNKDLNLKDRVFCVFDMDTANDDDIDKAIKKMPKNMQLIVSNPDFELWLLLHYEYRWTALDTREPIKKFRKYMPDYQKPCVDKIYRSLKENEKAAFKNAQLLREHQTEEGHYLFSRAANPYTNVDEAILYISDHCKS
ncbi:RloB family protein [Methanosphaerula subterraneus]|uniref:RloB family protein n=1 Tax=Methanosphaerula subterraneus TaxID=3350244 RepID=UPI003F828FA2